MTTKTKDTTAHTLEPRDGSALNWLVVNPDGKLLAVLDSESEAHFFTKNRGHANGAFYFKTPYDYAAAPELVGALRGLLADGGPHSDPISRKQAGDRARAILASCGKATP